MFPTYRNTVIRLDMLTAFQPNAAHSNVEEEVYV